MTKSIPIHAIATQITQTTCPYCGVGCGVEAQVFNTAKGRQVHIRGDQQHPANQGRLCIKGSHLGDTLALETRLLTPMLGRKAVRRDGSWHQAISSISDRFLYYIQYYGTDSIAFYVSGQLLTEDYYVVNKLVKGYLGTANIDTNSRLCMSSAVAAHKRAFGEDLVPASYQDFEHTEMVVLVGSNTAWCHPVLYQRIMQAKAERDLFVVVIDPRFTATCESADLHLPILPGQDVLLFQALLQYLNQAAYRDDAFIAAHTQGLTEALEASQAAQNLADVAQKTGVGLDKLKYFLEKFAQTPKVMTLFSMGVNQSSQGVNKANSIINCHLISGKIGKLGAAPFSMTGQPNAMGGREVGGLANMLASHLDLENVAHQKLVQEFWQSPQIASKPGPKAVDLFERIERGEIKAVWIMATNPVVSLPNAEQVKRALAKCEFVVVSDVCTDTDTTVFADVLLPALAWGEKEGSVTNSERCISRQRAFLPAPGQAKADWWAVAKVAQQLGFQGFNYQNSHDIFLEHAQLSAYQNAPLAQRKDAREFRYFNLQGLSDLSLAEYQNLQPIQWPVWQRLQGSNLPLFAQGEFSSMSQKAQFIVTTQQDPVHLATAEYPLILNTGRVRNQWHTMTRTSLAAALNSHEPEPYCEIHAQDALKYAIKADDLLELRSQWGHVVLRAKITHNVRRGQVFAPIHWHEQNASDARIGKVVNPVVDAISGEPEFKHTPVRIQPFYAKWQGVLYIRRGLQQHIADVLTQMTWWVKVDYEQVIGYELVDRRNFEDIHIQIKKLLPFNDPEFEWLSLDDVSANITHQVILKHGIVIACLYIAPRQFLPEREWVAALFKRPRLSAAQRQALLAGQAISATSPEGPLVCSCFKVGKNRIVQTIITKKLTTEKQVTACLKAGGNCGSCLPEIRGLLKACDMEQI